MFKFVYYQIIITSPQILREKIEEFLYENIPQGWETIEIGKKIQFNVFIEENNKIQLKKLENLLILYPELKIEYKVLKSQNWAEIWKVNFKPIKVGKNLVILPPWEKYQKKSYEVLVVIEPGQAFGTGHHATTQMMLENIEKYFENTKELQSLKEIKILDLGCGTGILGIACAKLCQFCKIWAIDIDEEALKAAFYNIKLNKIEKRIILKKEIPQETFDLILANIGYKELKKMASIIKKISKRNTQVFLSGFLFEDKEDIMKIYQKIGFKVIKIQKQEEWGFIWFKY
ncbi:hypothetical protein DRN73_03600 [Candidatus Pacearchaeota archaeon]|nr:MAG: hypothetical protein DRN73_03600 [Candidatus Pacearchaeota archaeon]